tara:strand:+ start:734 stop:1564 length:831 start_codon:yes stop_codon:yes gene_type:complete
MFKRIISRLDVKNGILVKGISLEGLRNLGDPNYYSQKYYDDLIDEIHFQDVVASLYDRNALIEIIEKNSKSIFVNVSVGGGIRTKADVDKLLRIGVDKIVINSAGVKNPNFLENLVKIYGASTIAVNIDTLKYQNKYEVLIETGREKTGLELNEWVDKLQKIGVGEIIITDISLEGKKKGFDINFYEKLRKRIDIPLIAHGGAGSKENILEIFKTANVDGVSIASLFHYKYLVEEKENKTIGTNFYLKNFDFQNKSGITIIELKKYLLSKGIKVRI